MKVPADSSELNLLIYTILTIIFRYRVNATASRLPEFNVVEDCIGEILLSHVGIGSSNEHSPGHIEINLIGCRLRVRVHQDIVDEEFSTTVGMPRHVNLKHCVPTNNVVTSSIFLKCT